MYVNQHLPPHKRKNLTEGKYYHGKFPDTGEQWSWSGDDGDSGQLRGQGLSSPCPYVTGQLSEVAWGPARLSRRGRRALEKSSKWPKDSQLTCGGGAVVMLAPGSLHRL